MVKFLFIMKFKLLAGIMFPCFILAGHGFFPVDAEGVFSVPTQDPEVLNLAKILIF